MDSKTTNIPLIIGSVVVLAVIAYGAYAFMQKDPVVSEGEMMKKEEGMMKDDTGVMEKADAPMEKDAMKDETMMKKEETGAMEKGTETSEVMMKGSYEAYTPEKIARADTGDVILFFHAAWCPSCRGLSADIEKNLGAIPTDVSILKLNYDTETALKKKYGVTYQHTLVQVDKDGNLIKKWSGSPTLSGLVSEIQ